MTGLATVFFRRIVLVFAAVQFCVPMHTSLLESEMSDTPFVLAGDSAVYIGLPGGDSVLFVRDIEVDRARKIAQADRIVCASDFPPEGGLSGDRDTAIAQAAGEFLRREGIMHVKTDRSLAFIYAHHIHQAGVTVEYDPELGVRQRRMKEDYEIEYLRECQAFTSTVKGRVYYLSGSNWISL